MEEKKETRGGKRPNSGAKKKADIEKANEIFLTMIKSVCQVETDEQAKGEIAKQLWSFERGQMFIAEHIFGKAPQEVNQTNLNIDVKDLDSEEIKRINKSLEDKY